MEVQEHGKEVDHRRGRGQGRSRGSSKVGFSKKTEVSTTNNTWARNTAEPSTTTTTAADQVEDAQVSEMTAPFWSGPVFCQDNIDRRVVQRLISGGQPRVIVRPQLLPPLNLNMLENVGVRTAQSFVKAAQGPSLNFRNIYSMSTSMNQQVSATATTTTTATTVRDFVRQLWNHVERNTELYNEVIDDQGIQNREDPGIPIQSGLTQNFTRQTTAESSISIHGEGYECPICGKKYATRSYIQRRHIGKSTCSGSVAERTTGSVVGSSSDKKPRGSRIATTGTKKRGVQSQRSGRQGRGGSRVSTSVRGQGRNSVLTRSISVTSFHGEDSGGLTSSR